MMNQDELLEKLVIKQLKEAFRLEADKRKTRMKNKQIKCECCQAKIGVNALEYEYKSYDSGARSVEIVKCPVCGDTIKENWEDRDESYQIDESECKYSDGGGIVINSDWREDKEKEEAKKCGLSVEQLRDSKFFDANFEKWHKDIAYRHKHVVIANQKVQGVFDEFSTAIQFAGSKYEGGKFIVKEVRHPDDMGFSTTGFKYGG